MLNSLANDCNIPDPDIGVLQHFTRRFVDPENSTQISYFAGKFKRAGGAADHIEVSICVCHELTSGMMKPAQTNPMPKSERLGFGAAWLKSTSTTRSVYEIRKKFSDVNVSFYDTILLRSTNQETWPL